MPGLIITAGNQFKSLGDFSSYISFRGVIRLWCRRSVDESDAIGSATLNDSLSESVTIPTDLVTDSNVDEYMLFGAILEHISTPDSEGLVTYTYSKDFRITDIDIEGGYTIITVETPVDRAFYKWTMNDGSEPSAIVTNTQAETNDNGDAALYFSLPGASNELRSGAITFDQLLITAVDPTALLIKIYSDTGVLLDVGHPDIFGYYRPEFDETRWESTLFGGENCPCSAGNCNDPEQVTYDAYSSLATAISNATAFPSLPASIQVDFGSLEYFAIGLTDVDHENGFDFVMEEINQSTTGNFTVYLYDSTGTIIYDSDTVTLSGGETEMTGTSCNCEGSTKSSYMVFRNLLTSQFIENIDLSVSSSCSCGGGE